MPLFSTLMLSIPALVIFGNLREKIREKKKFNLFADHTQKS